MPIIRSMSFTKMRCYMDCPRMYRYRYIDHLVIDGPKPSPLVAGDLLHRSLAIYHSKRPQNDREALDCVQMAIDQSNETFSEEELRLVRPDVLGHILEYHQAKLDMIGKPCRCETPLKARVGPITLISRADIVWKSNGVIAEADWKTSLPPVPVSRLQAAFLHAGLRTIFPQAEIEHHVVAFRPAVRKSAIDLTAESYKAALAAIFNIAREIGNDRSFLPTLGHACTYCVYAEICETASTAVEAVKF